MCLSQQNVSQWLTDIEKLDVKENVNILQSDGYVYDAVWTIALALNKSISILEDRELGRLEDFTYESDQMANIFKDAIANLTFPGISVSHYCVQLRNTSMSNSNRGTYHLKKVTGLMLLYR